MSFRGVFRDDGTAVFDVPPLMRMRQCQVCGALEEFTVMGPKVGFFDAIPSACGKHVAEVRAYTRGEKIEIQRP